jgi:hypothetical protein
MSILRSLVVLTLLAGPVAGAQAVETPVPFDSAGRVTVITPTIAARAQLGYPVWRVVGDFREARLYSLGTGSYVMTVSRPNGAVERFSLVEDDVTYLRARVNRLPPRLASMPDNSNRGAFIRNQTLLGLSVYAPAFSISITDHDAGAASAYLLVSGATFFAASQLARDRTITGGQNSLATHAGLHGGGAGLGIAYAVGGGTDARAASAFAGGLLGSAAGLYFGRRMTEGDAAATGFGADLAAGTALGLIMAARDDDPDTEQDESDWDRLSKEQAGVLVAAMGAGYWLGYAYPRSVRYNISAGDVGTLWVSGLLGTLAASTFLVEDDAEIDNSVDALALTGGFVGGVFLGDRLFVRRYDQSRTDAALMGLGGIAGGFIGLGLANLVNDEDGLSTSDMAFATVGAVAGVGITHYMVRPLGDEGRLSSRLRLTPSGLALAAAGIPGKHPVFSLAF